MVMEKAVHARSGTSKFSIEVVDGSGIILFSGPTTVCKLLHDGEGMTEITLKCVTNEITTSIIDGPILLQQIKKRIIQQNE